ncbi:hypothetical protein [Brevibacterium sp. Mu109]|uniref:hypothetical protein n=1 Tax=Brevibacterium sp. Mu109 TaxID=1255669 RepID=UPI0011AFA39C|nr:hypothetical protein [Brevibacterium sp. Mu109]
MVTPMFARTALSAAVTVALVSAPATLGAPAFGQVTASGFTAPVGSDSSPAPTATETQSPSPRPTTDPDASPSPTDQPDDDETHEADDDDGDGDDPTLPDGAYAVQKAERIDTFALYQDGVDEPFVLDDSDDRPFEAVSRDSADQSDDRIIIRLPDPDRDFVLQEDTGALNLATEDGDTPYRPGENGEGDRTFEFDVDGGTVGEVTETTPDDGEDGGDDGGEGSPEPEETEDPEPTPDPTEDPTPPPTEDPEPSPAPTEPDDGDDSGDQGNDDDSGDDGGTGDDGSDENGSDEDGSGSGERDDRGLTEDPSTGNGSDNGDRHGPRESAPDGNADWVPTGPQRPDYSDPVPQPPGTGEDDAITPDGEEPTQPGDGDNGDDGSSDDVASDSASEDGDGAGMPWQIGVVVAIGAAAIAFILFVAGRRRRD